MTQARPSDYWFSPDSLYIRLNAAGDRNYIHANCSVDATIMCYMRNIDGLGYDNGHNYRRWQLVASPTVFHDDEIRYVYIAIPRSQKIDAVAQVVFPSEIIDIYGKNEKGQQIGSEAYFYIYTQGIISESRKGGAIRDRYWFQNVETGSLASDEALSSGGSGSWWEWNAATDMVSFLKTIASAVFQKISATVADIKNLVLGGHTLSAVAVDDAESSTPDSSDDAVVTPAYASRKYISKTHDDVVRGVISFDKHLEFGEYLAGSSGAFLGTTDNGTLGEVDYLKVRKKAQFETLEIAEVKYIGGKLIVAPGDGMTITAIDELSDGYKCYYKAVEVDSEGLEKRVNNKFQVGDQIYCHITNISSDCDFFNKYWWRLCTEVGDGYFIVSKDDCDSGSDAPEAGDTCAQLGNRSDRTRQSAIMLSTIEVGHSPVMSLFGGIDSYTLEGRDHVTFGADGGIPFLSVYGNSYIGARDGSSYFRTSLDRGVQIKGEISAESSVNGMSLGDFASNSVISQIADDGIISPFEKQQLVVILMEIRQEYADLSAKAKRDGIDCSAYSDAFWALLYWLTGETREPAHLLLENDGQLLLENDGALLMSFVGVISDLSKSTEIDRDQYMRLFREYFAERDKLQIDKLYGDYTKTIIDGGLITTGSVVVKGGDDQEKAGITGHVEIDPETGEKIDMVDDSEGIRIWAGATKADRANAPFRVNQAGKLWATGAEIDGNITANTITLGRGAGLVVMQFGSVVLPWLSEGTFRTVDIWLIRGSRTDPYLTFYSRNDHVHIMDDPEQDVDDLDNLYDQYSIDGAGFYRLLGFGNSDAHTYWSISKISVGAVGSPTDHTFDPLTAEYL